MRIILEPSSDKWGLSQLINQGSCTATEVTSNKQQATSNNNQFDKAETLETDGNTRCLHLVHSLTHNHLVNSLAANTFPLLTSVLTHLSYSLQPTAYRLSFL